MTPTSSTSLALPSDVTHKIAFREELRLRATDPKFAEERRVTIAAKQAKRMSGVVVEIRRKRA
ncbi:hypothetical protein [Bradyrhizobium diazoefficiens]|uniref:hypothetical protein n=1 Tax=Bradyrhizobium diazoefficiens TaxID=1355477 RepID=UPI0027295271|nr:hypothetical protein [Bradyrhizobium diazoefficiens]WLA63967.1 hypothetical protein QNN01_37310 [Bradyrhizobium diazoefficiens]